MTPQLSNLLLQGANTNTSTLIGYEVIVHKKYTRNSFIGPATEGFAQLLFNFFI